MYKVICKFMDLQDENYIYEVGATYPRKGSNPNEDRIAELASDRNKIGQPLIKEQPKPKRRKKADA